MRWRRVETADHLLMLCSVVLLISTSWVWMLWLKLSVSVLTRTELSMPIQQRRDWGRVLSRMVIILN